MRASMVFCFALTFCVGAHALADEIATPWKLTLRSRWQPNKGIDEWREATFDEDWKPEETAIIICDLWDAHWCQAATKRCGEIAEKMAPWIEQARANGVKIVHAPSETMEFYKETSARKRALAAPKVEAPFELAWKRLDLELEGPLPIDDTDGGCDDKPAPEMFQAWKRQHPAVRVADEDAVSDQGTEIYNYFQQQGVKNVLFVGVHTNMCVLGRSFGIRQMTRLGFRCALVRDFTDTMYDPADAPYVPHEEGTELVVRHIEKYWCPSTTSEAIAKHWN